MSDDDLTNDLVWKDYGDSISYLHKGDGYVLAEIVGMGQENVWSAMVGGRALGKYIGRDEAKAACVIRAAADRNQFFVVLQGMAPPPPRQTVWQWLLGAA